VSKVTEVIEVISKRRLDGLALIKVDMGAQRGGPREAYKKRFRLREAKESLSGSPKSYVFVRSKTLLYGELHQGVGTLIPSITGMTLHLDPLHLVLPRNLQ
jgi:hypothetical protein